MVKRFLNDEGIIKVWPKKQADKTIVVEYLATKFESDRTYTEREVNEIIKAWHTFSDWPLLRREMVDRGFMTRDTNGYVYRRVF